MDGYAGKRAVDGLVVSRKGSGLLLRDTANNRDQNTQFCNRIGCSGRLNSVKGTQTGCSEKAKSSRPSARSPSSDKEVIGSSSRTSSAVSNPRKSFLESRKKLSSQLETDSSETSSIQDEPEVSELSTPPGKIQRGLHPEYEDAESSGATQMGVGSSSVASSTRSQRNLRQKSVLGNQDAVVGSSISLAPRSSSDQPTRATTNRYGLRNLRCNSISDVIPSGCPSSSDSSLSRRKDAVKKRNSEGESSSSARGKKMSGPSYEGRNSSSSHGISISDSRQARNWLPNRDNGAASVRTRRSTSGNSRARLANQGNGNSLSSSESHVVIPQVLQPEITVDANASSSLHQISAETSLSRPSYSRPGSSSGSLSRIRPGSPAEVGITRSLMNRDSFHRYNMNGIAEVLLALERIENDDELTYEQILSLETSLFLNGLNFYDQHRDMRLDIDNMSYEELLALEERMGSVSTAITEEALSNCLKRSTYQSTAPEDATIVGDKDDVKCCICQEEYVVGDEVGRLKCEHRYHVQCIHQWLRLKNWCPICKASVASSSPPSSLS